MTVWRLYWCGRGPLVEVVPDAEWPGMWRIRTRDGRFSDIANLARAKDAATLVARSKNPSLHDMVKLRWKKQGGESGQEGPQWVQKPLRVPEPREVNRNGLDRAEHRP